MTGWLSLKGSATLHQFEMFKGLNTVWLITGVKLIVDEAGEFLVDRSLEVETVDACVSRLDHKVV